MKVVCNAAIIEKCDADNINDYDISYMNKLNRNLKVNGDLTLNSHKNELNEICDTVHKNSVCEQIKICNKTEQNADESDTLPSSNGRNIEIWNSGNAEDKDVAVCQNQICIDSGLESAASSWDKSVTEVKELAFTKLEEELQHAREVLKLRDEEVVRLRRIRQDVENELLELTASLFQEAHRMVCDANIKQAAAEKSLRESNMKVEVLTAEVAALKTLVLTSTPSKPNLHLHNQVQLKSKEDSSIVTNGSKKKHNRSPSHFDLKYGRESPSCKTSLEDIYQISSNEPFETKDEFEVDPNIFREFVLWRENPNLEKDNPFVTHMYREDIDQCLDFSNTALVAEVKKAIDTENIFIEAVDKAKSHFPKKCALMEIPRLCFYRMKISDSDEWHYISLMCRNRIIAVCNFLNYLRYIQRGLVKCSAEDMYWEVVKLRKEMMLAKLGLPVSSHAT